MVSSVANQWGQSSFIPGLGWWDGDPLTFPVTRDFKLEREISQNLEFRSVSMQNIVTMLSLSVTLPVVLTVTACALCAYFLF